MPNLSPAEKLEAYLQSSSSSDNLSRELTSEFADLVTCIIKIDERSEEAFNGKTQIKSDDLLKALIKVCDFDSDIPSDLRIICLNVLRKVIELQNKK